MYTAKFHRRDDGGYDAFYGKGAKKLAATLELQNGKWAVTYGTGVGHVADSAKLREVKEGWAKYAEAEYGGESQTGTEPADLPLASDPPSLRPPPPSLRRTAPPNLSQLPARKGPPSLRMAQGLDPTTFVSMTADDGRRIYEGSSFASELEKFAANPSVPKAEAGDPTCPECLRPHYGWRKDSEGMMKPPCRCEPTEEGYHPDPFDPRMYASDSENRFRVVTPIGVLDMVYDWMLKNREYVTTDGKLDPLWLEVQQCLWRNTGYAEHRPERWGIES